MKVSASDTDNKKYDGGRDILCTFLVHAGVSSSEPACLESLGG